MCLKIDLRFSVDVGVVCRLSECLMCFRCLCIRLCVCVVLLVVIVLVRVLCLCLG